MGQESTTISAASRADRAMDAERYTFTTEAERDAYRKGFEDGRWDIASVLSDVVDEIVRENKA